MVFEMDIRSLLPCSIAELQRRIGYRSYSQLHRRVSGRAAIGISLARKIEAATDGQISAASILGLAVPHINDLLPPPDAA